MSRKCIEPRLVKTTRLEAGCTELTPLYACNTCRRKKVKCDGKRPICSSCTVFKLPCGFEDTEKQPRRSTRYEAPWTLPLLFLVILQVSCYQNKPNLESDRAYVDELEQRVKHMDDEMRRLSRAESLLQQSCQSSKTYQASASGTQNPVPLHSEPESDREKSLSRDVSSPDYESSRTDLEASDQPSCVLRAQDGKMRFFGRCVLIFWYTGTD